MNYSQSLKYLNSFLNLERIVHQPASRLWNLERMQLLLKWARVREQDFFSVLIAGTKGKGSTGFFLESILTEAGVKTGFYSSPHLEDPRERIRLNGEMVSAALWAHGVKQIQNLLKGKKLPQELGDFTYFEMMTLLAVLVFREAGVKAAIFEVGMGGRLDATNALDPKLVLLTPIALDHEAFLGNTIAKIAREKAAIIKPGCHAVVAPQQSEAMKEIVSEIKKKKAVLWHPLPVPGGIKLGLAGDYQKINAGMAKRAACLLREKFNFGISDTAIVSGLEKSGWPGRMEKFPGKPEVILDGAHNPISIEALVRNMKKSYSTRPRILVFGTSRDKKSAPMLEALSRFFDEIVLTRAANPRSYEVGSLLLQARGLFRRIYPVAKAEDALVFARKQVKTSGLVVVTGSFYLLGEVRPHLRPKQIRKIGKKKNG